MYIKYETERGAQFVNSETGENIQAYGKDERYTDFKKKLDSGEIVAVNFEDTKAYSDGIKKTDINTERKWIDSELERVRDKIEEKEDVGLKAPKLRAYRVALKQYKSDLYMPNVSRPTL